MAGLARTIGGICLAAAVVMGMLAFALAGRTGIATADELTAVAELGAISLLLAAAGAVAWLVGDSHDRAAAERRKQPGQPYGASARR